MTPRSEQPTIYLSGPISGRDQALVRASFNRTEIDLRILGYEVINPLNIHGPEEKNYTWAAYMIADLKAMIRCQAALMLPEWEKSLGARIERRMAMAAGIKVYYSIEDIQRQRIGQRRPMPIKK